MEYFDLTPDPKVLIALARTPLQPLDALCELIDNAIDSFHAARIQGVKIEHPLVAITLPRPAEMGRGQGAICIRDNGPGLDEESAEKAVRAGFSGNNPYDTLGLFGMGFNIASAKCGRITRLSSAKATSDDMVSVTINLDELRSSRSYKVPVDRKTKPTSFDHGTEIHISNWWPEGDQNAGFVTKLVQYGMPTIRAEIGRRYATLLKSSEVRLHVNGEPVTPFEHCAWADHRSVERRPHGRIPAVYRFNEVIGAQQRCVSCTAIVPNGLQACPDCGEGQTRTIEERIRGWVGIQRYDSPTDFGIDLIRNGRTIRIGEKAAFFEFTDELKRTIKDYPVDSPYGRIIGEVHLDHIPVDFLKQDFQRSTPEWSRAMAYLRGESSLQPSQPGADSNTSPVYKLYQGYRRVRTPGTADMYMGYWDKTTDRPQRIDRDTEKSYTERFKKRVPGFFDDSEWWKLVEAADHRPIAELTVCDGCGAQNLEGSESCGVCGNVLISKACGGCAAVIPRSAVACPQCGLSLTPVVERPWTCSVCGARNRPGTDACEKCGEQAGTPNSLSPNELRRNARVLDELKVTGLTVELADGSYSTPISVIVYATDRPMVPNLRSTRLACVVEKGDPIEVFVDLDHPLFRAVGMMPEEIVAFEVGSNLFEANRRLVGQHQHVHSPIQLAYQILSAAWGTRLGHDIDVIRNQANDLFHSLKLQLPNLLGERAIDIMADLQDEEKRAIANNYISDGGDLLKLGSGAEAGALRYISDSTLVRLIREVPQAFFDGQVWNVPFQNLFGLPPEAIDETQKHLLWLYTSCLEELMVFRSLRKPDGAVSARARASLEILKQHLA